MFIPIGTCPQNASKPQTRKNRPLQLSDRNCFSLSGGVSTAARDTRPAKSPGVQTRPAAFPNKPYPSHFA